MLTQICQAGLAFQMRISQAPALRHLRWSLLQRSTFEGLIRAHVHPGLDELVREQSTVNCQLLRGLLVMLCAQDESFRRLRGEDAVEGSVRDLVLNHLMYALHFHEGADKDGEDIVLEVGAEADANFDLVTYWTSPNKTATPQPRLGVVLATASSPSREGYDSNLLVFLLRTMRPTTGITC